MKRIILATLVGVLFVVIAGPAAKAYTEKQDVNALWGFIEALQSQIALCINRFPELRREILPIHENVTFETSYWVSDIKNYYRKLGHSEDEILQLSRYVEKSTKKSVTKEADFRKEQFQTLCRTIPPTYKRKIYMFRPLETIYPKATRALGR